MIYCDHVHLITDGPIGELHTFAQGIGLKREWFQDKLSHPHYDLTTHRMQVKAIKAGAMLKTPKEIVQILRDKAQAGRLDCE